MAVKNTPQIPPSEPSGSQREPTVRIAIKAIPGSSREGVVGWLGETLKVRVAAPPERGRANTAIERLVALTLGVSARNARVVVGPTSPQKVVEVSGLSESEVRRRLEKAIG